jgi:hypothetical protein
LIRNDLGKEIFMAYLKMLIMEVLSKINTKDSSAIIPIWYPPQVRTIITASELLKF